MKTLRLLKMVIHSSANTAGLILLCAALFAALMPFTVFSSADENPTMRQYQHARGSRVHKVEAQKHREEFLTAAGLLAAAGVLLLTYSAVSDHRRRRHVRNAKQGSAVESGNP
jgi:hypothetical protein